MLELNPKRFWLGVEKQDCKKIKKGGRERSDLHRSSSSGGKNDEHIENYVNGIMDKVDSVFL